MNKILLSVGLALILSGCSNPKNKEIPTDPDKWDTLKPEVEKLNDEEKQLLTQYIMRKAMGQAFGGGGVEAGTTIGDAIDEQRNWIKEKDTQEKAEAELKAKVEAQKKAKIEQVNKILTVALTKKEGRSTYSFSEDPNEIYFEIAFENKGVKDISGVKGVAHFNDMFGDNIKSLSLSYDEGVKVDQMALYKASTNFNQFMSEDKALLSTDISKIKFTFEPQVVLFADGSKIEIK